jgi:hypothetical protein
MPPGNIPRGAFLIGHDGGPVGRAIYRADKIPFPDVEEPEAGCSHAMFWMGNDQQFPIAEASMHGIAPNTLTGAIKLNRLNAIIIRTVPDEWVAPAIATAQYYLAKHQRYAYLQLLMLHRACRVRHMTVTDASTRAWAYKQLQREADILSMLYPDSHLAMVCSELLYRVFSPIDVKTGISAPPLIPVPTFYQDVEPDPACPISPYFVTPGNLLLAKIPGSVNYQLDMTGLI